MEPTFQLTAEAARALAMRLFTKEEFAANPRACIISALDWLDCVAGGDNASAETVPAGSKRGPVVEQLASYISAHGLSYEVIGEQIGASATSIGRWLRGTTPKASSLGKIRSFFARSRRIGG
jgi:hypothetical protein